MNVNTKNPEKYSLTPERLKQAVKASQRYALKKGIKMIWPKKPLLSFTLNDITSPDMTIADLKKIKKRFKEKDPITGFTDEYNKLIEHFAKYKYSDVKHEGTGIKSFCVLCGKNK